MSRHTHPNENWDTMYARIMTTSATFGLFGRNPGFGFVLVSADLELGNFDPTARPLVIRRSRTTVSRVYRRILKFIRCKFVRFIELTVIAVGVWCFILGKPDLVWNSYLNIVPASLTGLFFALAALGIKLERHRQHNINTRFHQFEREIILYCHQS